MSFWTLLATTGVLSLLGLIMVLSVTTVKSTYEHDTAGYYFTRQACFLVAGLVAMGIAYKIGYRFFLKLSDLGMGVSLILLIAVLKFGSEVNGATRWFGLGIINLQPSEVAKLAIILWVARLLARRGKLMHDPMQTIAPVAVVFAVTALLIYLEPDLGTVIVLAFVVGSMLIVAGARLDVLVMCGAPVMAILGWLMFHGYHAERWGFLNPLADGQSKNYQLLGSLSSIATGGWFGVGPGASMAKWGFLPEAHTDAIFAVIAEETGVLGALVVIAMYGTFIWAGMRAARDAPDRAGRLVAVGISSLIGLQALVNIGVVLGALPNKGFTLPFISYGGSSLMVTLFAVGILLSVARAGRPSASAAAPGRIRSKLGAKPALKLVPSSGPKSKPRGKSSAKKLAKPPTRAKAKTPAEARQRTADSSAAPARRAASRR